MPAAPVPRPAPRPAEAIRAGSALGVGGGWLVLGSWGLGGDELSDVGVDVVEVVVVVVVEAGVVRPHLLDARGDAPHRLHVRLRGRPAPRPPPFDPPSPPGSHAPSCLSLGARGALALAPGPPSGPHASVPLPLPWVPPPVTMALACPPTHRPSLRSMQLGALPAPLRALPRALAPSRLPALCRAVRLPALCPPPLLLASVPRPCLRPCSLPRMPWPAPCACPWALPLSPPVPRSALPWMARSSACAPSPPSWITRRASRCLCSCGSVTPGAERSGAGGRTCRVRPGGKFFGGNGLRGLVGVWVGLAWARYFAPSLPTAAAAAASGEAPVARAGSVPRFRGVLGAAAWAAEAVARLAGAAVATPRAPSPLPSAAAAALGDAPGSGAGATPRVGGVLGAAVGAAAWLAGAAVSAPRASGAPNPGRGGRACCLGGGGGHLGPWVGGPVSAEAARGCPAGGPTSTAASGSRRSLRSTGASPAHSGETGERERDRRWWRLSRWGEPSESDITVILVGMRGGRCALLTTSRCISVVPWAVLCSALRGGGGRGWGAGCGVSPVRAGAGGHPSALGGEAGEPRGPRVTPQLPVWGGAQGPGPPGVVRWCRGEPH